MGAGLELEHEAQRLTLNDAVAEVLHGRDRVSRLDSQIERVVESAPAATKAVIEALQALRGVAKLTAITIVTEVGTFRRFRKPTDLMGYAGLVPSEYSSGGREARGRITKTGNAHLRHVLGESAWHARHRPWLNVRLKKALPLLSPAVAEIAWKAQERLHRKFTKLTFHRSHQAKWQPRSPANSPAKPPLTPPARRRRTHEACTSTTPTLQTQPMQKNASGRGRHGKGEPSVTLCGNQPAMPSPR
jgi:transposase